MEKSSRKILPLIAFVLGICFLALLLIVVSRGIVHHGWGFITSSGAAIWFSIVWPIILISAILLNIFGWLKNGLKRILIAAILYLLSLNIPSAVLCFIAHAKMKKQTVVS